MTKQEQKDKAYTEYNAMQGPALREYNAKCNEIDGKEIKIICAAIKMTNGDIIRGHRHHNCIRTVRDIPRMKEMQLSEQGFMTSNNEFVDREEAYIIFLGSGEISCDEERSPMSKRSKLYSEDLY